jgi:hypothetical protein
VLATRSRVFGGEDGTFVAVVGTGPMQGHSWVKFEGSRDLIARQNDPCFLVKGEKLVCCGIK